MNEDTNDRMDDLLVKYMLGEASASEQEQVQQWRNASSANELYFSQLTAVWEKTKLAAVNSTVSEDDAWLRFQQKIKPDTTPATVVSIKKPTRYLWRVAAAVLVLAVTSWLLYNRIQPATTTLASGNTTEVFTLPDGSVVTLNKNSTVSYHKNFSKETRTVELKGEAFFDIAPNKSIPFEVTTANDIAVKVLGTSFNIKNTAKQTEVIVETGLVEVSRRQQSVRLQQHEKLVVSGDNNTLKKQSNNSELYNHYRTHSFVCNATPLAELVAILNEAYNTNIEIGNPALQQLPITATLKGSSVDSIINIVCLTLNIKATRQNNRIILE